MTFLDTIRGRGPGEEASPSPEEAGPTSQPFDGYDSTETYALIHSLAHHSQVELEAVEAYERAHKNRIQVLYKLRYLRQSEPLPGYDTLSVEEILTEVAAADDKTVKKIRGYERKFANRPAVLEPIVETQHTRKAARPAEAVPAYQPLSATSSKGSA